MEVIEIVENEPTTARAFQCDWETCGKVRSPASSGGWRDS